MDPDVEAALDRQEMTRVEHLRAAGVNVDGIPDDFDDPRPLDLIALGAVWRKRLNNTETWIDRSGHERPITALDPDHRLNVMGYLRTHAARLQHVVGLYELSLPPDVVEGDQWAEPQTPVEWIRDRPLFKALVAASTAC